MLILGVDPGSRYCGYGLLEVENKKIVAAGCDYFAIDSKLSLGERLLEIKKGITRIIDEYTPDMAAVETIFFGKNIQSSFLLGHVRGVIICTLAESNIEIFEYSPREIKKAVVGNGNASKQQVKYMLEQTLKLKNIPKRDDAADGLAAALCLYNQKRFLL